MGVKSHQESSGAVFGVDVKLADRALLALLKHHESPSSKEQLLGNDLDVQVQFTLVRVPGNSGPRPVRIDIPHPLANVSSSSLKGDDYDDSLRDVEACIIVKDASKEWVQEMITRFPSHLGCIKKVLTLQSLRIKHKTYDQRRLLLGRFDVFFADDRIVPMLSKALGTKFFDKKKQPIPVRLSREEALPFAIQRCLKSTYMYLSSGTCLTVRAGNTSMSPSKLLENIMSVCSEVPTKVPRKWSNVRSVSIKTTNSVALPIYNKTPEELAHIARLARVGEKDRAGEEEGEDMDGDDGVDEKRGRAKAAVGAADTPLARALKKQRAVKAVADGREEGSSEKKRKGPTGEAIAAEIASDAAQKSSKKEKKGRSTADGEEAVGATTAEAGTKKTPKSSKKVKTGTNDDAEEEKAEVAAKEAPKSSKKKKRKGAIDGDVGEGGSDAAAQKEEVAVKAAQGQKSAKKVKRGEGATTEGASSSSTSKKEAPKEEVAPKAAQEQKSAKKVKRGEGATTEGSSSSSTTKKEAPKEEVAPKATQEQTSAKKVKRGEGATTQGSPSSLSSTTKKEVKNEDFVDAKKFNGAKRGYVFRNGPSGIGYYRDVLPVVDKSGLAGLLAKTTGGGNRKSMGGNAMKRKKGGNSRRSY